MLLVGRMVHLNFAFVTNNLLLASNRMQVLRCVRRKDDGMRLLLSSQAERLFPEEVNIIYDSKCNVCKLEIDFLARRDATKINVGAPRLKMTDLEARDEDGNFRYDPNDLANGGITYEEGLKAIHAVTADGKVIRGVPVFALAYEQVQLGWLFKVTTWPIVKHLVEIGYRLFAKYRTTITRGATIETLVQEYEQKMLLQQQIIRNNEENDCNICRQQKETFRHSQS